jgi:hypothetical protein
MMLTSSMAIRKCRLYLQLMSCALILEGYHRYECGREDVYEATMGKIMQQGKQNAEGVKKVHRLALKVDLLHMF